MTTPERFTVLDEGPSIEEREARLTEGADELVDERAKTSFVGRQHFLLTVAGALMALGVTVILIGWAGASNATVVEEQVPYLISGGLLGLALSTIGALTLFSHWQTQRIREARSQEEARRHDHDEMMEALRALASSLADQEDTRNGRARSTRSQRPVRRAPRGS
jgi:hypothetical protein